MSMNAVDVTVLVCTYRRPHLLAQCLRAIQKELQATNLRCQVVVVDNDAFGSAAQVPELRSPPFRYVVEQQPGLVAARNRALREAPRNSDFLIFVDDDEEPTPGWLHSHYDFISRQPESVVAACGPVPPAFDPTCPKWVIRAGFFERPALQTGDRMRWPGTGNVILRGSRARALGEDPFDLRYNFSGGEDTEFFRRLKGDDGSILFNAEAIAPEHIPPERATLKWLWQRGMRLGNNSADTMLVDGRSRFAVAVIAAVRLVAAPILAVQAVIRRHPVGPAIMHAPKSLGMLQHLRGRGTAEYAR
jgi:succinoglycan biosynthesis protein ExoM